MINRRKSLTALKVVIALCVIFFCEFDLITFLLFFCASTLWDIKELIENKS